jgi:hypothetical protein
MTQPEDPATWLASLAPAHRLIQREAGFVTAAALSCHGAAVSTWLAAAPAGPVLLYCEDAGYFLAGLLGALAAGRETLLPGHAAPGYIQEILPYNATVLTDIAGLGTACLHLPGLPPAANPLAARLPATACLNFFTSGSSGQPKPCRKTVPQLTAEIAMHRQLGHLHGSTVLGTVSHQHIYGMLFRILFPLATDGTIHAPRLDHWETILPLLTPDSLLVSSPAHLTRLPPALSTAPSPAQITSSGAPLPLQAADACARIFNRRPLEILGSTETGGIAWRYQTATTSAWTPLPGVELRTGERLELRSPFTGSPEFIATGDLATQLPDGRFHLGARDDRIVKIEGKRISLQRVEDALRGLPEIHDAAALSLDGTLAAAVVLSEHGQRALAAQTAFRTGNYLRAALAPRLEAAERPKRWRFVSALPVNAEGKRTQPDLLALFAPKTRDLPVILGQSITPGEAMFELELPENLRWFDGHFPGQPLLPGVAQLHIAAACARLAWQKHYTGREMSRIKFRRVLTPNQRISLRLTLRPAGDMDFQYFQGEDIAASGTFKA